MNTNVVYCESCLNTLRKMPDKFLDSVITSPPYWQLRDYGYPEQWGLEPTFQEYLEHLWSLMDLIWLKLKDTGTVWINLGDSYAGSGGSGGDYNSGGLREGQNRVKPPKQNLSKCLLLLPHRFAIGCIERGWIVRNDIIWAKRNGMPESVTDRFSKKHEYMFFMVKQQKYYFDLEAVREKTIITETRAGRIVYHSGKGDLTNKTNTFLPEGFGGKNPGSVSDFWDIPTKPNSVGHYAVYNLDLLKKPILAGSPEFVCVKCGKARERIVEVVAKGVNVLKEDSKSRKMTIQPISKNTTLGGIHSAKADKGFTSCDCNAEFKGGIIYDPFAGSGTTGIAALKAGRQFIGSEMSTEYAKIANEQIDEFQKQHSLF